MRDVAPGGDKGGNKVRVEKLEAKVVRKRRLSGSYWWFELEFGGIFRFKAGQYVSVKVNESDRRSYSIATAPGGEKIGLLVDISPGGVGSKFFEKIKVGEQIEVLGSLGRFVVPSYAMASEGLVFVGTGSGIAPLKAMIEDLLLTESSDCDIELVWGMRFEKDLFWVEMFEKWEKRYKNFKFKLVLSKPGKSWLGKKGHVTDILKEMKRVEKIEFYLCGSNQMVEDCESILLERGVKKNKIYFEKYG